MKKGFTLVELSIVLVIIGLLIGGILVAQSMIGTAKIQSQIRQISQFDAGVANFVTKFNSIPGDSTKMSPPGWGQGRIVDSAMAGNAICGPYNFNTSIANFWVHMGQSGFATGKSTFTATIPAGGFDITSSVRNSPQAEIENRTGVIAASSNVGAGVSMTFYAFADYSALSSDAEFIDYEAVTSITPNQMIAIEAKMDNGNPTSGSVRALSFIPAYDGYFGCHGGSASCVNGNSYVTGNDKVCGMQVQIMSQTGGIPNRSTSM